MNIASVVMALGTLSTGAWSSWSTDYWQAQAEASRQSKPLAVVIGSGANGYEKVSREGGLSAGVQKSLADYFVAVYVDASTAEGKRLAEQLEVKTGVGLVISDRSGKYQVFHHDGSLPERDLLQNLERYGNSQSRISFYQPAPINSTIYAAPAGRMRGC